MKIYNIGILILLVVLFISCKEKKKAINEDFINLSPDKNLIKKQYNRYWTFNPFFPEDSLYTPIGKSKKRPNMPLGLIKGRDIYNLDNFYKYVKNNSTEEYIVFAKLSDDKLKEFGYTENHRELLGIKNIQNKDSEFMDEENIFNW